MTGEEREIVRSMMASLNAMADLAKHRIEVAEKNLDEAKAFLSNMHKRKEPIERMLNEQAKSNKHGMEDL